MRWAWVLLLFLLPTVAAAQTAGQRYQDAQDFFSRFVLAEQSYDPALAEFYADSADLTVIEIRGEQRYRTTASGATYKALLPSIQPIANNIGEYFTYSNVTIAEEGDAVRILATRTSHLKGYSLPYMARVARGPDGQWRIVEELTIVKP